MMNGRLDLVIPEKWESRIHSLLSTESQNPYAVLVLSETVSIAHQCFGCCHLMAWQPRHRMEPGLMQKATELWD